jgi:hypothetical protein
MIPKHASGKHRLNAKIIRFVVVLMVRTHTKNVWILKEGLRMAPGEGFEPSRPVRTTGFQFL